MDEKRKATPEEEERMLQHVLKQTEIGVRMMFRDRSALHAFDYDKDGRYVFMMAVLPKEIVDKNFPPKKWTPTKPL